MSTMELLQQAVTEAVEAADPAVLDTDDADLVATGLSATPSGRRLLRLADVGSRWERFTEAFLAFYDGAGHGADDPSILRALADWMERVDDAMDAALAAADRPDRVGRTMQADLRRIADRLEEGAASSPAS